MPGENELPDMVSAPTLLRRRSANRNPSRSRVTPDEHLTGYEWNKLTDEDEIRLLVLKPGLPMYTLECELIHVRLCDNPSFEAISYAWESEALPRTIYCSERPLHITENLFLALQHFRLSTAERILWVDALCINQRDLVEKGQQVSLMGTIFRRAQRVRVWLGDESPDTALAFSCLQHYERESGSHSLISILMKGNTIITAAATDRLRDSIGGLFRRKYWSRLWMVQEVAQSVEVVVHCGTLSLPFNTVFLGLQQVTTETMIACLDDQVYDTADSEGVNVRGRLPSTGLRTLKLMYRLREEGRQSQNDQNLASLLSITRHCDVTDPRDRIFALLSLSGNESLANPFPIDYTISASEMFSRFAEWHYRSKGLGLMSFANTPSQQTSLDMPSWAPNWTELETFRPLWDYTKQFCAGGKQPPTGVRGPDEVLNINGKFVDFVANIVEHPASHTSMSTLVDDIEARHAAFIAASASFFDTSKTLCLQLWNSTEFTPAQYDRYWRALVANTHYGGDPALESDGEDLQPLVEHDHLSPEQRRANLLHAVETNTDGMGFYPPRSVQEFRAVHEIVANGRVFITSQTRADIGWAPYGTWKGDIIVVFEGGEVPFVIRPVSKSTFRLLGECYLHGIMFGEAWADAQMPEAFFKLV
ncbi:hypothetical protein H2200_004560 [Cladophialophora chaetospira]|uniref:Heterokaryon incompatibility domain-containing protein n=1 Tax=Cladophialophora chaetospira TaxID=386627 RepID=A0AA38XDC0_9EURO|nr:hypothetical protein H2200_004560 [Cladophialophora chaetospira]